MVEVDAYVSEPARDAERRLRRAGRQTEATGNGIVDSRRVKDIVDEFGGSDVRPPGVPVSRLIDLRDELTALIKSELYGGGNKTEGRAALLARQKLDEFFFHTKQSHLTRGNVGDIDVLKSGIILETLAEQVDLLDRARDAGGGSQKGIQTEMLKLMNDPDRFDRFSDKDKAAIREIARGWSFFAKSRLQRLHEAIRRRGIPYMHTHTRPKTPPPAQGDKRSPR